MSVWKKLWKFLKPCLIAVGLLILASVLLLGACIITSEHNQSRLLREGQPIVAAIEAFRKTQHRFPKSLAELNLPPTSVDRRWNYFGEEDGRFGMNAYIGMSRVCIRYVNDPDNPDRTGWYRDNENGVEDWMRLIPPKP